MTLDIRRYVGRRHQPNRVAKRLELARPMVGRGTGFDANQAWRQFGKNARTTLNLAANDYMAIRTDAVNLKHRLRNIETDCRNTYLYSFKKKRVNGVCSTIGLDIAKSVFQIHGVDTNGNVVIRRQIKRRYVLAFFSKLLPCLVGIEACASSHHWSRELKALGHTVRLMPPAYVKPYVKSQKNDAIDAEAICEAVTRAKCGSSRPKHPSNRAV